MKNEITIKRPTLASAKKAIIGKWGVRVVIGLFVVLSAWQMYSTSGLRKENRTLGKDNKELLNGVAERDKQIESDSLEIAKNYVIIDSLYQNELRFRAQLNSVQRKYENIQKTYDNSSSSDRWDLFFELLSND